MKNRTYRIYKETYDCERALYNLCDTEVEDCIFAGPADGESAFKEARDITLKNCSFSLRYPLWHTRGFSAVACTMDGLTRAPIWYSEDGELEDCLIEGIKCLRECCRIVFSDCKINSPEFGWKCSEISLNECEVTSEYFLFECREGHIDRLTLKGKYSFQYTDGLLVENSILDTKDAFWHAENVTVRNCILKGEYLGWYSRGLTLENCKIIGTQPLCYCENLTLIDCTMEDTDLAFEYSQLNADITGHIVSVKNPRSGHITADSIGEIILEGAVVDSCCEIKTRL